MAPINAWTSFIQVIVGNFFISKSLGEGTKDEVDTLHDNLFQRHSVLPFLLGLSYILCGIGSWIYHASLTRFGLFLDYANIMITAPYITTYSLVNKYEGDFDESWIDLLAIPYWMVLFVASYGLTYEYGSMYTAIISPIIFVIAIWAFFTMVSEGTDYYYIHTSVALVFIAIAFFSID